MRKVTYLLPKFWERVKEFSLNVAGKYREIGRPHLSGEYSFLTKEHGVRDSRIKKGKKFPAVSFSLSDSDGTIISRLIRTRFGVR